MKNLLVTLADEKFTKYAKQLFSSAYHNAAWKGDYMLLAHQIPQKKTKWFKKKGIIVKQCKPIAEGKVGSFPAAVLSKFYLFTPEFKKWDNIVYLDADIIARSPLEKLTKTKGFAALPSVIRLKENLIQRGELMLWSVNEKGYDALLSELEAKYDLNEISAAAGLLAFNTRIISKEMFSELVQLNKRYNSICIYPEQLTLNLFFYKKWERLPQHYSIYNPKYEDYGLKSGKAANKAAALHFCGRRLRSDWNYFYVEWKYNLEKAETIDLKKRQPPLKEQTQQYQKYLTEIKKRNKKYTPKLLFFKALDSATILFGSIETRLKFFLVRYPWAYARFKKVKRAFAGQFGKMVV